MVASQGSPTSQQVRKVSRRHRHKPALVIRPSPAQHGPPHDADADLDLVHKPLEQAMASPNGGFATVVRPAPPLPTVTRAAYDAPAYDGPSTRASPLEIIGVAVGTACVTVLLVGLLWCAVRAKIRSALPGCPSHRRAGRARDEEAATQSRRDLLSPSDAADAMLTSATSSAPSRQLLARASEAVRRGTSEAATGLRREVGGLRHILGTGGGGGGARQRRRYGSSDEEEGRGLYAYAKRGGHSRTGSGDDGIASIEDGLGVPFRCPPRAAV
ncbi:hypothetical protein F4780DRAFT_794044 [Xylariomycetidae sp. FL0641]|nr:hypothetical protein F4780DRAFT_794044 [Xylariomycetidae sp. FL0641]